MSISKKIAAIVSAVAVVASAFAAAPASAESVSTFANRNTVPLVFRKIDANGQIQYKAGEQIAVNGFSSVKFDALSAHANTGDTLKVEMNVTVVSGTLGANPNTYINGYGSYQSGSFNLNGSGTQQVVLTAVPQNFSINFNYNASATTDVTIKVATKVTVGAYEFVADDFNEGDLSATTGHFMPGYKTNTPVLGTAMDDKIMYNVPTVCVDTTGLSASDTLEVQHSVSNGTTTVGTSSVYWDMRNGMQPIHDGMVTTFALTGFVSGATISVNPSIEVSPVEAGKTYTYSNFKVVKQGTTTDLSINCKTTAATGTVSVVSNLITGNLNIATEAMPGFDAYVCVAYAVADTNHLTPIAQGSASKYGMNGPTTTPVCTIRGTVPAGTYSVGVRGLGYQGVSDEVFLTGTATVTAGVVTPAKKTPKVPTVVTKVKVAKTITVALHATKGTATKGANADGLATTVTVAAASKAYCSVAAVKKAGKITSYTVKGLKAGKCSVVLTVTGNATYASLTKTVAVTVSK